MHQHQLPDNLMLNSKVKLEMGGNLICLLIFINVNILQQALHQWMFQQNFWEEKGGDVAHRVFLKQKIQKTKGECRRSVWIYIKDMTRQSAVADTYGVTTSSVS